MLVLDIKGSKIQGDIVQNGLLHQSILSIWYFLHFFYHQFR